MYGKFAAAKDGVYRIAGHEKTWIQAKMLTAVSRYSDTETATSPGFL